MGKKTVQTSVNKTYSNAKVLQLLSKTLTILERDAQNGSAYAIAVLKEIFDNKEGIRPTTGEHQIPSTEPVSTPSNSQQVPNIENKSTSAADY